jgi:hypothetical protein
VSAVVPHRIEVVKIGLAEGRFHLSILPFLYWKGRQRHFIMTTILRVYDDEYFPRFKNL